MFSIFLARAAKRKELNVSVQCSRAGLVGGALGERLARRSGEWLAFTING